LGDFNKPVTVTLTGLPAGLPVPSVVVAAERSEFELPVAFPPTTKPGLLANVKLVATSSDKSQSALRSNEIAVAVIVEPPPPPALLRVFEDEAAFPGLLTDGSGAAALESGDKLSGSHSLKVTPEQRFAATLPGLVVKIRQNP